MRILLIARQLEFSINSLNEPVGILKPFEWGSLKAKDLHSSPVGARNLWLVSESSEATLFADGEKPFKSASECSANSTASCPANCPDFEHNAVISRRRRALLCLKGTSVERTLNFTCSMSCPAWIPAAPRLVWFRDGIKVLKLYTTKPFDLLENVQYTGALIRVSLFLHNMNDS